MRSFAQAPNSCKLFSSPLLGPDFLNRDLRASTCGVCMNDWHVVFGVLVLCTYFNCKGGNLQRRQSKVEPCSVWTWNFQIAINPLECCRQMYHIHGKMTPLAAMSSNILFEAVHLTYCGVVPHVPATSEAPDVLPPMYQHYCRPTPVSCRLATWHFQNKQLHKNRR